MTRLLTILLSPIIFFAMPLSAVAANCPIDLSEVVGAYDLTTLVTGSKDGRGLGTRGFYRVQLIQNDCKLLGIIAKAGYNNVRFKKEELQFAKFKAEAYQVKGPGEPRTAVFVDATLTAETGFELSIGMTLIGEMGVFRYLGEDWEKYGLWGTIKSTRLKAPDAPFQWVEKPNCTGKSLESSGLPLAGLFTCDELAFTTPDLRRVTYFHPLPAYGAEGVMTFDKLIDSGVSEGRPYAVFCAEGKYDERVALAVTLDGSRAVSKDVSKQSKYASQCKVRPPNHAQFEEPDRWGGTISGTKSGTPAGSTGAPTCDAYIRTMDSCLSYLPVSSQGPARDAMRQTTDAWRSVSDKAALEAACRSAWDAGRTSMGAMCPKVSWDPNPSGNRREGSTASDTASPFDEHPYLPGFVDRFCRGTLSDSDIDGLDRLARNRAVSVSALIAIFNLYGAFHSYEFKSELWLNDLYYGAGNQHLPRSCRPLIRGYRTTRDIPAHYQRARDRVRSIWQAVK